MKKQIIPAIALTSCMAIGGVFLTGDKTDAMAEDVGNPSIKFERTVSDIILKKSSDEMNSQYGWFKLGYSNIYEYHEDLMNKQSEAEGLADEVVSRYSGIITDEQKENLYSYETKMANASCVETYDKYSELFDEIVNDCKIKAAKHTTSYISSYSSGSVGSLTKSKGVNQYNGRRETWYSQRVLPGGGLNIPGRHVAEDGTIRDADGYICVAASDLAKGTIVDTSLGAGKVYDSGCAAGTTDIYTDW